MHGTHNYDVMYLIIQEWLHGWVQKSQRHQTEYLTNYYTRNEISIAMEDTQ